MERHGDVPEVKGFEDNAGEIVGLKELIALYQASHHESLGIICKTLDQATTVFDQVKAHGIYLLTDDSTAFTNGIVVTTVHLSKGLEFDEVIIPFASSKNYNTDVDRSMLYIACTRAMHRLTITYSRELTEFISNKNNS